MWVAAERVREENSSEGEYMASMTRRSRVIPRTYPHFKRKSERARLIAFRALEQFAPASADGCEESLYCSGIFLSVWDLFPAEMELAGAVHPNAHNQCWPEPTPFNLSVQLGVQIVQKKDEILLLYLHDQQVRRVRMNVPHSGPPKSTWQGESVGHYEGDTLVIDTIGQKVGPLSIFDMYGAPFSAALRVIERYRLIDGTQALELQRKHEGDYFPAGASSPFTNEYGRGDIDPDVTKQGLQVEITVDDPVMFNLPWRGLVTYPRKLR
jgi:hypothetical protein